MYHNTMTDSGSPGNGEAEAFARLGLTGLMWSRNQHCVVECGGEHESKTQSGSVKHFIMFHKQEVSLSTDRALKVIPLNAGNATGERGGEIHDREIPAGAVYLSLLRWMLNVESYLNEYMHL